jgi:hypothetical protein
MVFPLFSKKSVQENYRVSYPTLFHHIPEKRPFCKQIKQTLKNLAQWATFPKNHPNPKAIKIKVTEHQSDSHPKNFASNNSSNRKKFINKKVLTSRFLIYF